jgi:hypothetical protein
MKLSLCPKDILKGLLIIIGTWISQSVNWLAAGLATKEEQQILSSAKRPEQHFCPPGLLFGG